jgi:hypothetical protein
MKLTKEERFKFTESRQKLINEGVKMQRTPQDDTLATASSNSNSNSSSNSNNSNKSDNKASRTIAKLKKELKESKEESKSESPAAESNTTKDDQPSFAEVVKGLSKVHKTRVIRFIEDKSTNDTPSARRVACTRTNTSVTFSTPATCTYQGTSISNIGFRGVLESNPMVV